MTLPADVRPGDPLSATWINQVKAEVKKNEIIGSRGLSFNRTNGGTYLGMPEALGVFPFKGTLKTAINDGNFDLNQWDFAIIDRVTRSEDLEPAITRGADVFIKMPDADSDADKPYSYMYNRIVMVAEPIKKDGIGQVYVSSEFMIARVDFSGVADFNNIEYYRYATLDLENNDEEERPKLRASMIGPVHILNRGEADESIVDEAWCIIKFPVSDALIPRFAVVTEVLTGDDDGKLKVKLAESDGTEVGDEFVVYDGSSA